MRPVEARRLARSSASASGARPSEAACPSRDRLDRDRFAAPAPRPPRSARSASLLAWASPRPCQLDIAVASRANSSRPSGESLAAPGARPPDHRLVAGARQRHVGEPQLLAALLDVVRVQVRRGTRRRSGRRRSRARRRRLRRGSRRAAPSRRSGRAPTGTGSRRSGTRVPCCGGRSAPARRRRRSRAAG